MHKHSMLCLVIPGDAPSLSDTQLNPADISIQQVSARPTTLNLCDNSPTKTKNHPITPRPPTITPTSAATTKYNTRNAINSIPFAPTITYIYVHRE